MSRNARIFHLAVILLLTCSSLSAQAQASAPTVPDNFFSAMQWRCIGPHRGGRVLAVSGVRDEPDTFYFGAVAGGVWKTTDCGSHLEANLRQSTRRFDRRACRFHFRSQHHLRRHRRGRHALRHFLRRGRVQIDGRRQDLVVLGLSDTRQIGRVLIDPKNPDIVLVAALGHGFGPNAERGVYRTTDGGKTWTRVLCKDENTGAIDLAFDPDNSRTVYATLWNVRRPPYNAYAPITGPGGGIYKSTDGGATWKEIAGHGLPTGKLGRIGVDVVAGQHGKRVYALMDAGSSSGLYRSDDGGETGLG